MKRMMVLALTLALLVPAAAIADDDTPRGEDLTKRLKAQKVTMQLNDVTVSKALDAIARWANLNIVCPRDVGEQKVQVHVVDVSAWTALQTIAAQTNTMVLVEPGTNIVKLTPRFSGERVESDLSQVHDLRDLAKSWPNIVDTLREVAPRARFIEGTGERKGSIVVAGTKKELDRIEETLAKVRTTLMESMAKRNELDTMEQYQKSVLALKKARIKGLKKDIGEARKAGKGDEAERLKKTLEQETERLNAELDRLRAEMATQRAALDQWENATKEWAGKRAAAKVAGGKGGKVGIPGKAGKSGKAGQPGKPGGVWRPDTSRLKDLEIRLVEAKRAYEHARKEKRRNDARTAQNRMRELEWAVKAERARLAEGKTIKLKPYGPGVTAGGTAMPKFRGTYDPRQAADMSRLNKRLSDLKSAAAALKATGMRQQLDAVYKEIRDVEQQIADLQRRRAKNMTTGSMKVRSGNVMEELRALREEVHGLRAEVQMLNALVKKLLPRRETRRGR